ncbi:GvpL/GvpF family gas vesicle protein [Kitasatospora sp. NPDC093550]|uniref:GvpL/GvpF family gas vesicle protein n=1 Tax=Kitasatospora sp. NPDC093550 TaxID=3364089 RepID=UPI0038235D34
MNGRTPTDGRACYVYGIVPADADTSGLEGIGDPPAPVRPLRHRGLAALVSEVVVDGPLGTAADLRGHARVLDTLAARGAVLPLRFGAVVRDAEAVTDELLAPNEEAFLDALQELRDTAQFTLRATYRQERVLREVLADREDIAGLREEVAALPEEATYYQRVRLGELIAGEIAARRESDTADALERLSPLAVAVRAASAADAAGDQAVSASFLVAKTSWTAFEAAAEELARDWAERTTMRLLGPLAPYDFASDAVDAVDAVADSRPSGAGARSAERGDSSWA